MPITAPKVQSGSWRTVLVVDPDADNRARIAEIVRSVAAEGGQDRRVAIQEAENGNTAWTLVETTKPDLIICEILLEGLSGLQLLRRVRERYKKDAPKVFFVTQMGNEVDRYWALRNGATAFAIKPYEDEFLRERSLKLLEDGELELEANWPEEV